MKKPPPSKPHRRLFLQRLGCALQHQFAAGCGQPGRRLQQLLGDALSAKVPASRLKTSSPNTFDGFYYQITYTLTDVPDNAAYFHAQWRRSNPLPYGEVTRC
jgi:hypothetical protein